MRFRRLFPRATLSKVRLGPSGHDAESVQGVAHTGHAAAALPPSGPAPRVAAADNPRGHRMGRREPPPDEPTADLAYRHLLDAVERRGLTVAAVPDHALRDGDKRFYAWINMETLAVEVAQSVTEDLEHLVMVLAHELAHAYDPEYRATWMDERSSTPHAGKVREKVAQTVANEFCSLYLVDTRQAIEYTLVHGTRMSLHWRLRADVALCSLLPRNATARRLQADAERRWKYRWVPFTARRPIPKHLPLLRYRKTGAQPDTASPPQTENQPSQQSGQT